MYCKHLQFDYDPIINKNFLTPRVGYSTELNLYEIINPKFLLEVNKLGITISPSVELFYLPPNSTGILHRDSPGPFNYDDSLDLVKINFMLGGKDSLMHFYSQPEQENIVEFKAEHTNRPFEIVDSVKLIESNVLQYPSLVQTGVPHSIENFHEERYTVCLVPLMPGNKRLGFNDAVNIFKNHIV